MSKHTESHCHCGRPRQGSDHCMFCGCEEFETVCSEVWNADEDDFWTNWMTDEMMDEMDANNG